MASGSYIWMCKTLFFFLDCIIYKVKFEIVDENEEIAVDNLYMFVTLSLPSVLLGFAFFIASTVTCSLLCILNQTLQMRHSRIIIVWYNISCFLIKQLN
ncbi:hypothetical protein Zm00014a_042172 [Zea mays]|uniref:Uncharacterized protein n=1 Tax=Zea mays TaxID=4577 RepID=A0A3L6E1R7_MAIZE|nr:hypothetical protein Zm00014a_042172 [Zea mays]